MERDSKRLIHMNRILAGLIFVVLAGYAYLWTVAADLRSATREALAERARLEAGETAASSREAFFAATAADRAEIEKYVVREEDAAIFIEYVESLARRGGLETKLSSVAVEKDELAISLVVSGAFEKIYAALGWYGAMPYKVGVKDARLEYLKPGLWRAALDLRLMGFIPKSR